MNWFIHVYPHLPFLITIVANILLYKFDLDMYMDFT